MRTVLIYGLGGGLALVSFLFWGKRQKNSLFFWLWFLFSFFASIMPIRDWTPFLPARFMLLMWLPLSILAALSLRKLKIETRLLARQDAKLKVRNLVVGGMLLVGMPSAFFYSTWMLRKPLQPEVYAESRGDGGESLRPEYITEQEYQALQFLQGQKKGVVLCDYELGMYLPLLSDQQSVLGRDPMVHDFNKKRDDYGNFFGSGTISSEAEKIAEKYQIDYVVSGVEERAVSHNGAGLESFKFLEKLEVYGEGKDRVEVWGVRSHKQRVVKSGK